MNPGVPNWEAMNQPKHQRTRNIGIPPQAGNLLVLMGRSGQPCELEWVAPSRASIALKVRSSAPDPNPPKTGTRTALADSLNPLSLLNGGTPGEPQSILGRLDPLRSRLRDRSDASAPDRIPTEPAWLFGRKTHHRI